MGSLLTMPDVRVRLDAADVCTPRSTYLFCRLIQSRTVLSRIAGASLSIPSGTIDIGIIYQEAKFGGMHRFLTT